MPSTRRVKFLAIALAIAVCTIFYLSNDSSSQEFYTRTVAALDKKEASDLQVAQKLQEVKDAAKAQEPNVVAPLQEPIAGDSNPADFEVPKYPVVGDSEKAATDTGVDGGKSVAGRKKMKGGETKDLHSGKEAPMVADKEKVAEGDEAEGKEETGKTKEDHEVEIELNSILKKGPIIIFSKTFCPYSSKAKKILLEKYTIVPGPYVVELDTHPMGKGLQAALERSTGRRTVPNVLVNGRSIGGGDDIQALDDSGELLDKIKGMAGKRIMEAKLN